MNESTKTLIIGAEGLAGAELMRSFPLALGTTHRPSSNDPRILPNVDITRADDIRKALDWVEPQAVVNCAGIVKSECDKHTPDRIIAVNSTAPHTIANLAAVSKCRVIHLSTDCVFDGTRGERMEIDSPDATDSYGRTKADGELNHYARCVTLRTSFIGVDRTHKRGLLEWLFTQKDEAMGFTRAIWSGLSMPELARAIAIVLSDEKLAGLYHVPAPSISKADLLEILVKAYNLPCRVRRVDEPFIDRSLNGEKFKLATGYEPPAWLDMAEELARL